MRKEYESALKSEPGFIYLKLVVSRMLAVISYVFCHSDLISAEYLIV
jgi:hypothetical protein